MIRLKIYTEKNLLKLQSDMFAISGVIIGAVKEGTCRIMELLKYSIGSLLVHLKFSEPGDGQYN